MKVEELDFVLVKPAVQRCPRNPQFFGGLGNVAIVLFQYFDDRIFFDIAQFEIHGIDHFMGRLNSGKEDF